MNFYEKINNEGMSMTKIFIKRDGIKSIDFDVVQVRVSVRVADPTPKSGQSPVSLTFQKSEILTQFYK